MSSTLGPGLLLLLSKLASNEGGEEVKAEVGESLALSTSEIEGTELGAKLMN